VYVTFPDLDAARRVCHALVEERLVACASFAPVQSVYRWEGRVHDEPEVAAFCKTRAALVPALAARVKELHPYAVPCVVALAIEGGNEDYLAWVDAETAPP
jgi:periplasmic divalent cation tolerance protein